MKDFDNEYNFKTISNEDTLNKIAHKITSFGNDEIKVIEFGTGIGAITIPILKKLLTLDKKNKIEWEGFDNNVEAISYFKEKLKSEFNLSKESTNNSIILNNTNVSLKISLKIYDIERGIINNTEPFNSEQVYDIIFMPSFLYHITFWKTVLVWAYNHLKENGFIILGYPSGVWSFPEKGFLSVSDKSIKEGEKIWFDAWQSFYKNYPNYYLFFRRHYNELHDVLLGNVIIEDIIEVDLTSPDKDILKQKIKNKQFAFNKSDCPFNFNIKEEDINKLTVTITSSKNFDYKYTFEVLQKKDSSDKITLKDMFAFNHSLNSKSIDTSFISKEPKTANQLLNYGLVKTLLGEGILERQNRENLSIIGSYVGYHLDNFIKKADDKSIAANYDVMFFSLPKKKDIEKLHNYLCFYNTLKSAPITEILKTILPKTKPFCKYLLFEYNCDGSSNIITSYDDVREIAKISITIPNNLLENKDLYSNLEKKDNEPKNRFSDGKNELIILQYSENNNDVELNKLLDVFFSQLSSNSNSDVDELNIYEFYKQLGNEKIEIRQRLQLLAYLMLKSENKSSLGIPLKITINGEQKLLGIIWLVYNKEFNEIENDEIPIIDLYLNNILYPIIGRINLALIDLLRLELDNQQLKTAIISILIDSYAHNISAHSLAALKWWIELRYKMLDKRFKVPQNGLLLNCIKPCLYSIDQNKTSETTEKYYEALGQTDSTYNKDYYSLFDFLQFTDKEIVENLFQYSTEVEQKDSKNFHPRFPVPIDYALYPFFRFLRDKGAFWSGVTRDMAFGGESKTWFQILWEDFANNPLYLGTIAKTEDITKINIYLAVKLDSGEWINGRFVTIDLSVIDYEEKMVKSPELDIQYSVDDYEKVKNYIEKATDEKKQSICNQIFGQQNCNSKLLENIIEELGKTNEPYINRKDIEGRFNINGNKIDKEKLLKTLDDIVKEIYLSNDIEKCDECVVEKNSTHSLKQECSNSITKQIEISNYSKYAFVKLGKCFGHFREILDKDDYEVFLPGGLVGEHALFTIFENTIRNIKHYKDSIDEIKKSGINFWIAIEKENLENSKTDKELFKVQTWLMHETNLFDEKENKTLWQKVTDKTIEKILDESGVPKMGGNSQDKACAAMLFNNEFKSVENTGENTENKRDKDYYPWIRFTSANDDKKFDFNYGEPINYKEYYKLTDKTEKENFLINYKNSVKNKKGYLRKSLFMWRAADYFILNDKNQLEIENISRFKFVIVSYSNGNKELINVARDKGVIRLLSNFVGDINGNKNDKLKSLYLAWLSSIWLKDSSIGVNFKKDDVKRCIYINNNRLITKSKEKIGGGIDIYLSHGGGDEASSCNVRSHGAFWSKYFSKVVSKQPEDLAKDDAVDKDNDYILLDLLEVICTKIVIFDDRINNRFIPLGKTKIEKVFEKQLQLYISGEISPKENEQKSEFFKDKLNKLCQNPHILIVHLSYIESIGYSEENINSFIDTEIKDYFNKDNFIFIITTGRGRGTWSSKIKEEYKSKTMFKPVESLLNAVESGISYNDNFDVKYNLIKVIFGS